jgi:hypothetical protein
LITASDIKTKALSRYPAILSSVYSYKKPFPMPFPGNRGSKDPLIKRIDGMKNLIKGSIDKLGYGYRLITETRDTRTEGTQTFIKEIIIDDLLDYLKLIGKEEEFNTYVLQTQLFLKYGEPVKNLLISKPLLFLNNLSILSDVIKVLDFFNKTPKPSLYIRELPIEVHTKFIEQNKVILTTLLDLVLPEDFVNSAETNFENRYGLKIDRNFYIHIRFPQETSFHGLNEVSVPIGEINKLDLNFEQVVIVENRMIYLTYPLKDNTLVIWGMGKGVALFKDIDFLHRAKILYWGDIDPQGFEILNNLRSYFPETKSFLMDLQIFNSYKEFVHEINTAKQIDLPYLTKQEESLYKDLFITPTTALRLEQERIRYS